MCFPQVRGGVGHLCTCAREPPSPCLRIRVANCAKIWCVAAGWRPNSYEIYKSGRWGDCTFARASPVPLSRKPLSPGIEATPKTNLPISFALARSSPNMASYWWHILWNARYELHVNVRNFITSWTCNRSIRVKSASGDSPAGRPWWRFWEGYISGTESPIDKRSSLVGNPIPSAVHETNAKSCQCLLWHVARATWGDVTNVPPAVSR